MRALAQDMSRIWRDRMFFWIVCLTAVCSYGFKISHITIGIDDTCTELYFEGGLAPAVGRWALFLVNKVFRLSQFAPWLTDLAGVIFLLLSAGLWCTALWRVFGNEVSRLGYAFFAAIFVSCPLISEVFVYYLHNGIGLGYGMTALALLSVLGATGKDTKKKQCCIKVLLAAIALTAAIGFYESFMMVYLIGAILLFLADCLTRREKDSVKVWRWFLCVGAPIVPAILFRSIMVNSICALYRISIPQNFNVKPRTELFAFGLSASELFMFLKRYFVKYGLNCLAYLPITVLVAGMVAIFLISLREGIRRKNFWPLAAAFLIPVLPALMILVDGKEPYYRASQYVPLIGSFAVFLLFWFGGRMRFAWMKRLGVFAVTALLWNQCADMNRWFYMDHIKYEYFKTVIAEVSYDLQQNYDSSKPIIFRGECPVPRVVAENSSLGFDDFSYKLIKRIGDAIDGHLIEKYNMSDGTGYVFAETPVASTIQWGITAFDGTAREIKSFAAMHGFDFCIETDLEKIEQAEKLRGDMPSFPQEGYIREFEEYIIVNL